MAIDIPGGPDIVLGNLETFVSDWGYLAILIGTFLEGETIVLVGGIAASQGWLEIGWVYAAAVSGSYAGDQAYFVATRLLGRPWVDKRPKLRARIQPVLRLLEKWGDLYVLIYRFIYGVRTVSAVAIGLTPYPIARFAVLNAVAVTIWALAFCAAGYFLGEAARHLVRDVAEVANRRRHPLAGRHFDFLWRAQHTGHSDRGHAGRQGDVLHGHPLPRRKQSVGHERISRTRQNDTDTIPH